MNLAQQLEDLQSRGFSKSAAQAVVLVRESAILLFQAFPDSFLLSGGASLNQHAQNHLSDALIMREIGADQIAERIAQIRGALCRSQLADVLPAETYQALANADFQDLRAALEKLYQAWL